MCEAFAGCALGQIALTVGPVAVAESFRAARAATGVIHVILEIVEKVLAQQLSCRLPRL